MEKIKRLTQTQKELIKIRLTEFSQAKIKVQQTIDQIGRELGVPESENSQWFLSEDLERLEREENKK